MAVPLAVAGGLSWGVPMAVGSAVLVAMIYWRRHKSADDATNVFARFVQLASVFA